MGKILSIIGALFLIFSIRSVAMADHFPEFLDRAEKGDIHAMAYVAEHYDRGEDVEQDLGKALAWYRKAAEHGHEQIKWILGEKYELGIGGLEKDIIQAYVWYKLATLQGHKLAQDDLQKISRTMTDAEREKADDLVQKWLQEHPAGLNESRRDNRPHEDNH